MAVARAVARAAIGAVPVDDAVPVEAASGDGVSGVGVFVAVTVAAAVDRGSGLFAGDAVGTAAAGPARPGAAAAGRRGASAGAAATGAAPNTTATTTIRQVMRRVRRIDLTRPWSASAPDVSVRSATDVVCRK